MMMIIIFVGKSESIKIKRWTAVSSSKNKDLLFKVVAVYQDKQVLSPHP